jgi:uncharacterized protein Yka (UPF0111/DUF47 family)
MSVSVRRGGALMGGRSATGGLLAGGIASMFSLQRLFSRSDKFYDLLEAGAEDARQAVAALVELLKSPQDGRDLEEFTLRRRHTKRISEELTALVCSTFVTPLEREDIEALSTALYKIPKTVEKFGERLVLSPSFLRADMFSRQAALLKQATDTVHEMVRQLRQRPHLDKIKAENDRLHQYEGEADKLILDLLRDLYSGKYEALQAIVLRDLYELLEKIIDRCRDAGNIIFQIMLKNS